MSDTARKVFPTETVLALLAGNKDIDVKELAGYITGRSISCCCAARVVGPMAAGWLAALYPAFLDFEWNKETSWADFAAKAKSALGENISLPPMCSGLQGQVTEALDRFIDQSATIKAQSEELSVLQKKVEELTPYQAQAVELDKKVGQLETKVKTLTTEANNLRKESLPFKGKMPVDQQELENIIKDAIKTNLKGLALGAAAGAVAGDAAAEAAPAEEVAESGPAPEFGFGASGSDSSGFGF